MAEPKDKKDELDAVTAAYESISAKLEELRQKQAESADELKPQTADSEDDDEAIAEIDIDSEAEVDVTVKRKTAEDQLDQESEAIEPLPGTEDDKPAAKKQVYQSDDPLDDESSDSKPQTEDSEDDQFEDETGKPTITPRHVKPPLPEDDSDDPDEDLPSLKERGAKLMADTDEMDQWEQMKSLKSSQISDEPKPTYQPLSQSDFQARLRKPSEDPNGDKEIGLTQSRQQLSDSDEPDSLEDLAEEPLETPGQISDYDRSAKRPTSVESLDDDWDIRRLRPQHRQMPEEEQYDELPQREFKRPQSQNDELYFDRRNQPLPRKKASIWHLFVLILIGVGVIGATVYFLKYQFNEPSKPTPSPEIATATPSPTPTPTPKPEVEDKGAFRVRVLNGTSKTGLAATVLAKLKAAGYLTDRAGNADNANYPETIIKVKQGTQSAALINSLTQDLGPEYSPKGETTLKTADKADVEIILGQK